MDKEGITEFLLFLWFWRFRHLDHYLRPPTVPDLFLYLRYYKTRTHLTFDNKVEKLSTNGKGDGKLVYLNIQEGDERDEDYRTKGKHLPSRNINELQVKSDSVHTKLLKKNLVKD